MAISRKLGRKNGLSGNFLLRTLWCRPWVLVSSYQHDRSTTQRDDTKTNKSRTFPTMLHSVLISPGFEPAWRIFLRVRGA